MYNVIIIGLGPAGMMAAIQASKKNKVLIIEKNDIPGKKLLLTGGGRCNVTNLKNNNDFINEVDYNKKYLYSTINNFGPKDIYNFFTKNGVKLKEEKDNQIFPISNKASDILESLIKNIKNTDIKYKEEVLIINIKNEYKEVITNKGKYQTKKIIIATGGSSFKITGSTGDNIKFAKAMNQPIINLFPAETSIILEEKNDLAGTSFNNVEISYKKLKKQGNLMYTHKGLSGAAIMKMSEHIYLNKEKNITIDFKPDIEKETLQELFSNSNREKQITTLLNEFFTKKFTLYILNKINIKEQDKIKNINYKQINNIIECIKNFEFTVKSVEKLDNAFVTGGGIDLKYIDTKTMESKINKGIYYIGEALDIHGPIGGYNITLALSTGYTAGSNI